jgi:hypothetical protein
VLLPGDGGRQRGVGPEMDMLPRSPVLNFFFMARKPLGLLRADPCYLRAPADFFFQFLASF